MVSRRGVLAAVTTQWTADYALRLRPVMGTVLSGRILDGATPTRIAAFGVGRFAS